MTEYQTRLAKRLHEILRVNDKPMTASMIKTAAGLPMMKETIDTVLSQMHREGFIRRHKLGHYAHPACKKSIDNSEYVKRVINRIVPGPSPKTKTEKCMIEIVRSLLSTDCDLRAEEMDALISRKTGASTSSANMARRRLQKRGILKTEEMYIKLAVEDL